MRNWVCKKKVTEVRFYRSVQSQLQEQVVRVRGLYYHWPGRVAGRNSRGVGC